MRNIFLILKREYLTRVRKKSFIVMTLLAPILVSVFYGLAIYAGISSIELKKVEIIDDSKLFQTTIEPNKQISFDFIDKPVALAKAEFKKSGYDALVFIPANVLERPDAVQIFAEKGVSMDLKSNIESQLEKQIEQIKLSQAGFSPKILESIKANVHSQTISLSEDGEKKSNSAILTILGGLCAMLIYITVIVYGTQVMRSVVEEKTSRVVEIIISSVKPFQLLMGKIIGVALVGLTQFVLWIILTVAVSSIIPSFSRTAMIDKMPSNQTINKQIAKEKASVESEASAITAGVEALNNLALSQVALILGCFLFYFVGGYLLYSSLFGAVGSAVDNETDTQQFMFPLTLPIVFSFIIAQFVIMNPDGNLAFWTSMIPFTSPIIMMVRIPFGVPTWQILLSMVLLILGFVGTTWIAARIYRVGILMYGKKVSFKELAKWIFYKS